MRIFRAALVALVCVSLCSPAWSQNDDPFGGNTARAQKKDAAVAAPVKAADRDVLDRAKKAMSGGRKPIHVASGKQYEAEKRIHSALNDKTTITFIETPLADALQVISQTHDIPILADRRALEEIGLSADEPVSMDLKNVSLRSALRLLLRDLDLTYQVKDEVLQITTIEAAECNLIMEMYVLPENLTAKSDKVITAMQTSVVPDTWSTLGGPSSAVAIDHVLVVSTTSDVHHQVEEFLAKLFEKYGK